MQETRWMLSKMNSYTKSNQQSTISATNTQWNLQTSFNPTILEFKLQTSIHSSNLSSSSLPFNLHFPTKSHRNSLSNSLKLSYIQLRIALKIKLKIALERIFIKKFLNSWVNFSVNFSLSSNLISSLEIPSNERRKRKTLKLKIKKIERVKRKNWMRRENFCAIIKFQFTLLRWGWVREDP